MSRSGEGLGELLAALPIPIIQAPMVGASLDRLAVAVSAAGGMGALAAGALSPDEIGPMVARVRAGTDRSFVVNLLMAPRGDPGPGEVAAALDRLTPWYAELGQAPPEAPNQFAPDFDSQLEAVIAAAPPAASFTFDLLDADRVRRLQSRGTYVIGTATTVAEARA
ncbi:MAG: nitronate monooxygenase, partial [Phenylobacterium sp.]|nr:nitronate monooxygenase [Phenylobacterium sp.]